MDYMIKEHGYVWWIEQEVKCPDCGHEEFDIIDQNHIVWMNSYVVNTHNDVEYQADMRCQRCRCAWTVSIKEKDAVKKESPILRSVS